MGSLFHFIILKSTQPLTIPSNFSYFISNILCVYYGCCKFYDKQCKCGYIREEDLVKQLETMLDNLDLDEIGMREHLKSEVERYKKFQSGVLGVKDKIKVADIEIRNYAKYVLREGTNFEKRELLSCLKSKLVMQNKVLSFDNSVRR